MGFGVSNQNWEPIIQVNEDRQNVQVFIKANGEGVQGLTVMAVDADGVLIQKTWMDSGGNSSLVARRLGVSRTTIYKHIKGL